jgi:hypothetical protein
MVRHLVAGSGMDLTVRNIQVVCGAALSLRTSNGPMYSPNVQAGSGGKTESASWSAQRLEARLSPPQKAKRKFSPIILGRDLCLASKVSVSAHPSVNGAGEMAMMTREDECMRRTGFLVGCNTFGGSLSVQRVHEQYGSYQRRPYIHIQLFCSSILGR